MQITDIKQQVKNLDRVSIFVDGKFECGLNLNQVLELNIKKGQQLSGPELSEIKKQSELGKIVSLTLDWLARRPRSKKEIVDYLRRKKIIEEEQDYVLQKVARYIDDEAFATFWVDGRRSSKNKSSRAITAELMQKGVSSNIIKAALSENEFQDSDTLLLLIAKKSKQTRYQDKQKFIQYLMRAGYSYSDVVEALEEVDE